MIQNESDSIQGAHFDLIFESCFESQQMQQALRIIAAAAAKPDLVPEAALLAGFNKLLYFCERQIAVNKSQPADIQLIMDVIAELEKAPSPAPSQVAPSQVASMPPAAWVGRGRIQVVYRIGHC